MKVEEQGTSLCGTVTRFCVKAEKRPKQYIKWEKSTFAEKNSQTSLWTNFPYFMGKILFSSKTSSDRLKLL
jgi:hypothetical protein